MGLIQIDSVNVLVRSQELPLFARLGPHPRSLIDDATVTASCSSTGCTRPASSRPTSTTSRWRMGRPFRWPGFRRSRRERAGLHREGLQRVADDGPLVAGDLAQRVGKKGTWWDYDDGKLALEALFSNGRITARRRPQDFARVYDLPERMLPAAALARRHCPSTRPARSCSCWPPGTTGSARSRTSPTTTARRGRVQAAARRARRGGPPGPGDGARAEQPAYMHPDATIPRRVAARALLSPFDPVVWNRERACVCSGSTTGSRSTRRRRSASTATTCCRSCSATSWSAGSTSRPTGRTARCSSRRLGRARRARARGGRRAAGRAAADGGVARARAHRDHGTREPGRGVAVKRVIPP